MVHNFQIIPATPEHARRLGVDMRAADAREVWAMSRRLPVEAVLKSLEMSSYAWAMEASGDIPAVFGVAPYSLVDGVGTPWALTGDSITRHALSCHKAAKLVLEWMLGKYPVLVNAIHADNRAALKWAIGIGFSVATHPVPLGSSGEPFYPIMMRKKIHV